MIPQTASFQKYLLFTGLFIITTLQTRYLCSRSNAYAYAF